ncbi:MAG: Rieske 2Fe-2S domain-containing protein [Solibacteraceae bacterium]|nr:Rieske 2Fe-2S domain-containing protein [Solibacteraceae bacterium]
MIDDLDRRELLRRSMFAVGFAPLCCVTPEAPASRFRVEGGRVRLDAGLVGKPGSAVAVVEPGRKLNLIVMHVERGRYAALDRLCTHGGAECAYNNRKKRVQCTSLNHAEYELDGTLLHGRTHGNLRAYAVRREGGELVIELEGAS